ncbi:MAG: hypothetical protein J1E62_02495 [Lachnospiraceae bacterium]|nr:hypothetical protein [Lachnospiraceae bacterium]
MIRMTFFEIYKIWSQKKFLVSVVLIIIVNIFLLWYINLSDGTEPELYSYKALETDIKHMSEEEKYQYVEKLYEDIQGIQIVNEVLMYRSLGGEMGQALEEQKMQEYSHVFEQYYETFQEGSYLKYTKTLEQEEAFIREIYEEMQKVYSYDDYLDSVQENKNNLGMISIFAQAEDNFSSRNIEKSAKDYENLKDIKTRFYPSKGIVIATENVISDMLLVLSVMLFAGYLMYEEKEKRLFYIIRATAGGRLKCIISKLLATFFHCIVITVLIYGANLMFFGATTGIGDLFRSIQSIAPLMESNLHLNVMEYCLISMFTKAMVFFCFGAFLVFVAVISRQSFIPWLAGFGMLVAGVLLYCYIPAYATVNWLKYVNFIGLSRTENIYGGYLNFNLLGHAASRMVLSLVVILLCGVVGVILSVVAFLKWGRFENKKIQIGFRINLKPHSNLLRHESYKILIMNKALLVLLLFMLLLGYRNLTAQYILTPRETYYRSMMLELEGKLTADKRTMIEAENARYEKAFQKIDEIDALVVAGELEKKAGDMMKEPYYSEVVFYPQFKRILKQYEFVKETNGKFIYDTGYLYLFGVIDTDLLWDFMLITICIILAFGNVMAMERGRQSWNLIAVTKKGKSAIVAGKIIVSIIGTILLTSVPLICRFISIRKNYPMHGLLTSLQSIPEYMKSGIHVSIIGWFVIMVFVEFLASLIVMVVVFLFSRQMKTWLQVAFISALVLVLPLVLTAMGFDFAGKFSLLPLYTMFQCR